MKLGVIGLSEGNGHPYSWSAIFNGYDKMYMQNCPFPVIPEYLSQHKFPEEGLSHLGCVTHIWTQDYKSSEHIAKAAKIAHICNDIDEMIGNVDAVLLARDDAENHHVMAKNIISAGIPIFIDKPFALSLDDAKKMLNIQKFDSQIFTCSSLRYADELLLSKDEYELVGDVKYIDGTIMKKWDTYAIHLLEPIIRNIPNRGKLLSVQPSYLDKVHIVLIQWENCIASIRVFGNLLVPITISYYGAKEIVKSSPDSFSCFRSSLEMFVHQIKTKQNQINREETLELIEIIEKGRIV